MSAANQPPVGRPSQTKIVATLGPASDKSEKIRELIAAGVDVFRINAAHGDRDGHQRRLDTVRRISAELGQPVAVLVDLAGPKIRLGELPGGQIECSLGDQLRFIRGTAAAPGELTTTYAPLIDELSLGDRVMLADGIVSLVVEQSHRDVAVCRVVQPGTLRSRQGVNLPGVKLSVPTLGEADRQNAVWAATSGVDFLGLSFVRSAADVHQLQELIKAHGSGAQVVAKIEKPEALDELTEIVAAADAVMVARGDLGVEIDIAEVAVVQKRIIAECHAQRKPVIIATQMLDSMQHSRIPTRAEVTDVANAILDGADACMLSGETAIGDYPRETVRMMHRIALATEPLCRNQSKPRPADATADRRNPITEATVDAAGRLAESLDARTVIVATASGQTALSLSKNRHYVPTVGVSDCEATLRRMCLYWGVIPLAGAPIGDNRNLLEHVVARGRDAGLLRAGDRIVLVAGTGLAMTAHNMIVVHELE